MATGYPGYNSVIPREAVAIGEILASMVHGINADGKVVIRRRKGWL
jgi:hypothetical protein